MARVKFQKRVLGCCFLLALGVVLTLVLRRRPEPLYEGRPLSDWIIEARYGAPFTKNYQTGNYNEQTRAKGAEAIKAIGGKAVPFYLNWIADEPSAIRQRALAFLLKHPWIPGPDSIYRDPSFARAEAVVLAFHEIGTNGTAAVPELTQLLFKSQSQTVRRRAADALGCIGPAGVGPLRMAAEHREPELRLLAVRAICRPWSDFYLNTLSERLSDTEPAVRAAASRNVISYCGRTESHFRMLTNALAHPNPQVRIVAISALERYGGDSIPFIQTLSSDTNYAVLEAVRQATFRLRYE